MFLPLFILAALASASPSTPIVVTSHQWAPFVSPMGEPFRAHSVTDDTLADWFYQADGNHDGYLTAVEMVGDAQRFFAKLDSNSDGQIDPDELSAYEYEVAPEIQVMSKTKRLPGQPAPAVKKDGADDLGDTHRKDHAARADQDYASLGLGGALQGAARYALLDMPEPVAAADTDFNRAITLEEFRQAAVARFELLDTAHAGRISLAQLEAMPHAPSKDARRSKLNKDADDARLGNPLPTGP